MDPSLRRGIVKYRLENHRCLVEFPDKSYRWLNEDDVELQPTDSLTPTDPNCATEQLQDQTIECSIRNSDLVKNTNSVQGNKMPNVSKVMNTKLSSHDRLNSSPPKDKIKMKEQSMYYDRIWSHKLQHRPEGSVRALLCSHRFQKKKRETQLEAIRQRMIEEGCLYSVFFDPLPENYMDVLKEDERKMKRRRGEHNYDDEEMKNIVMNLEEEEMKQILEDRNQDSQMCESTINQWCANNPELWDMIRYLSYCQSFYGQNHKLSLELPLCDMFPTTYAHSLFTMDNQSYYRLNYTIPQFDSSAVPIPVVKKEEKKEANSSDVLPSERVNNENKEDIQHHLLQSQLMQLTTTPSTTRNSSLDSTSNDSLTETLVMNPMELCDTTLDTPHVHLRSYYNPKIHQLFILRDPQRFAQKEEKQKRTELFQHQDRLLSLLSFNNSSTITQSIFVPHSFTSAISYFAGFNSMYSQHQIELEKGFALLKGASFHYHIQKDSVILGQFTTVQKQSFDSLLNRSTYHNNSLFDCDLNSQHLDSSIGPHCLCIYYKDHQWFIKQLQKDVVLYVDHVLIEDPTISVPLKSPSLININHHLSFFFVLARSKPT